MAGQLAWRMTQKHERRAKYTCGECQGATRSRHSAWSLAEPT